MSKHLTVVPPAPEPHFLTTAQAAIRLDVSERYIRLLIARRQLRHYKLGRLVRIDPRDLNDFVQTGCVEAQAAGLR